MPSERFATRSGELKVRREAKAWRVLAHPERVLIEGVLLAGQSPKSGVARQYSHADRKKVLTRHRDDVCLAKKPAPADGEAA
jgi:hypothetical protein